MTSLMSRGSHGSTVAYPTITVGPSGASPLPAAALAALVRAVVDTDLNQPDMFEITFLDRDGQLARTAGFAIGMRIRLAGRALGDLSDAVLLEGEITALEGRYEHLNAYLVVRGYDLSHRLQRVRRTRAFLNATDSDIALTIARGAGLSVLKIEPSEP
ncbi:MAG: hypothetical protein JWO57_3621, partial [Pseudonocardiales bacterium]|nr:hypothetical protein [Pseudonocardiales bacterium]